MHPQSYSLMETEVGKLLKSGELKEGMKVLDVGSLDVNGTYREIFEAAKMGYTGLDVSPGKNVDIVCNVYDMGMEEDYDLIISGQAIEHMEFPLLAVMEMKKAVNAGGWIILIAPFNIREHRYPIDCWRFLPDGMKFLLEGFENVSSYIFEIDTVGLGKKPVDYKERWIIKELVNE